MHVYDPELEPAPETWLACTEGERRADIAAAHAQNDWFDRGELGLHAMEHEVIETALAQDHPAGLRHLIAELCAAGFSRHDALHAIGWGLGDALLEHHAGRPADLVEALRQTVDARQAVLDAIGQATPGEVIDWLATDRPPDAFAHDLITLRLDSLGGPLLALLEDPAVRDPQHPHAPALAWVAEYFSLTHHPPAIEPTIEALLGTTAAHVAYYQLSLGLPRYGDLAVGPVLRRLDRFGADRAQLLWNLVCHGARDPRLRPALEAARAQAPELVAEALADLRTPGYVDRGTRMHCTAVDPADLDALKAEFEARIRAGGVGQVFETPVPLQAFVAEFEARLDEALGSHAAGSPTGQMYGLTGSAEARPPNATRKRKRRRRTRWRVRR